MINKVALKSPSRVLAHGRDSINVNSLFFFCSMYIP